MAGLNFNSPNSNSQFRTLLTAIKNRDDPTTQLMALQELAELLSIATEESLAGQFNLDVYARELVAILKGPDAAENAASQDTGAYANEYELMLAAMYGGGGASTGGVNLDLMLLACRCIFNLIEAFPPAIPAVVAHGLIPVLCSKLQSIDFTELAEQALSTLEKVSAGFPAAVVREGGLSAALTYFDFFAIHVQRTAITTAANCATRITPDQFPQVREIIPIIDRLLDYSDQRVVEQTCLYLSRVVRCFRGDADKLNQLVSDDTLNRLLGGDSNPSVTLSSPIFGRVVQTLALIARESTHHTLILLQLEVVDNVCALFATRPATTSQGSTVSNTDGEAPFPKDFTLNDLPADKISDFLSLLTDLLPLLPCQKPESRPSSLGGPSGRGPNTPNANEPLTSSTVDNEKRQTIYQDHPAYRDQFGERALPIFLKLFQTAMGTDVRKRVAVFILKIVHLLDTDQISRWVTPLPFTGALAHNLSQDQAPLYLVVASVLIITLLTEKCPAFYIERFRREGVAHQLRQIRSRLTEEYTNIDSTPDSSGEPVDCDEARYEMLEPSLQPGMVSTPLDTLFQSEASVHPPPGDGPPSTQNTPQAPASVPRWKLNLELLGRWLHHRLGALVNMLSPSFGSASATPVYDQLVDLTQQLDTYIGPLVSEKAIDIRSVLGPISALIKHPDGLTPFEFHECGLVDALVKFLTAEASDYGLTCDQRQQLFVEVFWPSGLTTDFPTPSDPTQTPAVVTLIESLHSLLGRHQHLPIEMAPQSPNDTARNPAAMLAKQIRLQLLPADGPSPGETTGTPIANGGPRFVVSIHALASFSTLEEYIKPRLVTPAMGPGQLMMSSLQQSFLDYENSRSMMAQGRPFSGLASGSANRDAPPTSTPGNLTNPSSLWASALAAFTAAANTAGSMADGVGFIDQAAQSHDNAPNQTPVETENQDVDIDGNGDGDTGMDGDQDTEKEPSDHHGHASDHPENEEDDDEDALSAEIKLPDSQANTPLRPAAASGSTPRSAATRASDSPTVRRTRGSPTAPPRNPASFHLEFEVDGKRVTSNQAVIYSALHSQLQTLAQNDNIRSPWANVFTVTYRRVADTESDLTSSSTDSPPVDETLSRPNDLPTGLTDTGPLLTLLATLYQLNNRLSEWASDHPKLVSTLPVAPAQFHHSGITAKLLRQLDEPLVVVSRCLPSWCTYLMTRYAFLFPFEVRFSFVRFTAFGYSRSIAQWQNQLNSGASRPSNMSNLLGRIQRQKVRISRQKILLSAAKVMELYGASHSILEIEYFDEAGTGLGPTLEFYATISRELCRRSLMLWRDDEASPSPHPDDSDPAQSGSAYVAIGQANGLFPRPYDPARPNNEVLHWFNFMGQFIAKALLDSRIIDIPLHPLFIDLVLGRPFAPTVANLRQVDPDLARSLTLLQWFVEAKKTIEADESLSADQKAQQLDQLRHPTGVSVDDLCLDFTLPGFGDVPLNTASLGEPADEEVGAVTLTNVETYLNRVLSMTLADGITPQVTAFQRGFNRVFALPRLAIFSATELSTLFGAAEEDWGVSTLQASIIADHGYCSTSPVVVALIEIMSEMTPAERRTFLRFITGSPKLPIGGFKALSPRITVVCKPCEPPLTPRDYLPSVMTCVNYLKVPNYPSKDMLKERLFTAMYEGQNSFHLS
ncbi:hypothetical protein BJ085DRAFT_13615 [Dimargaris cristalligena]|uniref:HECT-type E3 ubiquitin transferase n=1 Tax=Dimargaris cristalligena TaxID=215637 RepID=A0A4Q0A2H0_9FUNG|nr:hypothetical protein BJ085DRAFT_13615 [Dimargaris cristalligena]|eukprot:RKP39711.1 hypothetical protein BJ085DRAFT_13615 [Dimargaris cristalligena]